MNLGRSDPAHCGMSESRGPRSLLATSVGYVLVGLIAYLLLRFFVGTLFWLIRSAIVLVILVVLLGIYLSLKLPKDD